MCGGSPSMPATTTATTKQPDIAEARQANAKTTKVNATRNNDSGSLAGRDTKTNPRGLNDMAIAPKKQLLGE